MMSIPFFHTSVLCAPSVEALNIAPGGVYVDATLGGGGHSRAILERLDERGKLIVIDQDQTALERNTPKDARVIAVHANFSYVCHFLTYYGIQTIDGMIADLGVSSHQFDTADRGFSMMHDGPLDMRMNRAQMLTAQEVVEQYSAEALTFIFQNYGEVSNTHTLVEHLVRTRKKMKIASTLTLAHIAEQVARGENKMQYLAKVFQALRIEVNDELGNLAKLIDAGARCLTRGGRLAVISFHSLEDRVAKQAFRDTKTTAGNPLWKSLYPKPIVAEAEEINDNKRSRSAKLRVGIKQ